MRERARERATSVFGEREFDEGWESVVESWINASREKGKGKVE